MDRYEILASLKTLEIRRMHLSMITLLVFVVFQAIARHKREIQHWLNFVKCAEIKAFVDQVISTSVRAGAQNLLMVSMYFMYSLINEQVLDFKNKPLEAVRISLCKDHDLYTENSTHGKTHALQSCNMLQRSTALISGLFRIM